jgi:hypothetical protein
MLGSICDLPMKQFRTQADCQPMNSSYYYLTIRGLDGLMQEYFDHLQALLQMVSANRYAIGIRTPWKLNIFPSLFQQPASSANLSAPEYDFIWTLGQADIEGGIVLLNGVYLGSLEQMYSQTLTLQIVQLVLAAVLAAAFILLMLLPFVQDAWTETRRIAELLAQLPAEIDVEAMVARSLAAASAAGKAASKGQSSMPSSSNRQMV